MSTVLNRTDFRLLVLGSTIVRLVTNPGGEGGESSMGFCRNFALWDRVLRSGVAKDFGLTSSKSSPKLRVLTGSGRGVVGRWGGVVVFALLTTSRVDAFFASFPPVTAMFSALAGLALAPAFLEAAKGTRNLQASLVASHRLASLNGVVGGSTVKLMFVTLPQARMGLTPFICIAG
jgi:hypothetical protein